ENGALARDREESGPVAFEAPPTTESRGRERTRAPATRQRYASAMSAWRGAAAVAVAATFWGSWSLFLRPTELPGVAAAPVILVVMGITALPFARFAASPARWDRTTIALLGLYAVLDAINMGTFFAAMQVSTLAVAVVTHCTAPVIV